jgi:P-type conjugative transfer protein TrbJ
MTSFKHKQLAALAAATAIAATLVPVEPAHALFGVGDIVFDPGNFAQHLLILQQHAEQLVRLQQQVQLMETMLKDWDFSRVDETLAQMQGIHATLDGIAGSLGSLDGRFPETWDDRDPTTSITPAQRQWRLDRRTRNEQVVQLHQQVAESMALTQDRVGEYVAKSNAAPGQLAAQQATNELLAVQVQQLQELQALEIAALRGEMELLAEETSEAEWSARLREEMHRSHLRSIEQLNNEDRGPTGSE